MQILRPGARVPACLLQLTGLLGPTLEPGNSGCLCVHAANSPPWGFGWALGGCCARVDPECLKPPPETLGYVLQSQQISAARGHAVSSCSPRQEETLSLQQLSEIPNVLLCPAGMGRRQLGEGRSHQKAVAAAECWGRGCKVQLHHFHRHPASCRAGQGREGKSPGPCPAAGSCLRAVQTKEISAGIGAGVKNDPRSEGIKLLFSPVRWDRGSRIKV